MEVESDGEGAAEAVPKIKQKLPKVNENRSKKEHINVVFIGHVGKFLNFIILKLLYSLFMLCSRRWQVDHWWTDHVLNWDGR